MTSTVNSIPQSEEPQAQTKEAPSSPYDYPGLINRVKELKDTIDACYEEILMVGGAYILAHSDEDSRTITAEVTEIVPEIQALIALGSAFCNQDLKQAMRFIAEKSMDWFVGLQELTGRMDRGDYEGIEPEVLIAYLQAIPYDDYLKTPHWQSIRAAALERAGRRCQVCNTNKEQLHVHHRTYKNRGHEQPEDLIVLCATCHRTFHETGRLTK